MLEAAEKNWYVACLDLEAADCLVVGGGSVALEKVRGLLAAGAAVTVVASVVVKELAELPVEILRRPFDESDVEGRRLVIAATSDPAVNARGS